MPRDRVPKLCGADVELGNFITGLTGAGLTGAVAARALLLHVDAPYADRGPARVRRDAQDWGRKHLAANGGCVYIDLDHLECCLPEVLGAHDHVAAWHAMLRIVRGAQEAANATLPPGVTIHVLANNSDGFGSSWGSHLDVLVTRRAWDDLFSRKVHPLLWLAAFQVSSIVFTGQGKVGAENGAPPVDFQLSQRADFFETLVGPQTTSRRPIVNARDEALCGRGDAVDDLARLHCIFFDSTLCHGSSLLKIGTMQLVLAMLEVGAVDPSLILDDPVEAVVGWSHDPTLRARARLAWGGETTAVDLQRRFLDAAGRAAARGGFDDVVPRASEILDLWADTLEKLGRGDLEALAPRLDWVLKHQLLSDLLARRPDLGWTSSAVRHLDRAYASLDPEAGLYFACERAGDVERHVPEARVAALVEEPPEDTRAWTRARLLRLAAPAEVEEVDWDVVRLRRPGRGYWPTIRTVHLRDPLRFTRAERGAVIDRAATIDEVLDTLGASPDSKEQEEEDHHARAGTQPFLH